MNSHGLWSHPQVLDAAANATLSSFAQALQVSLLEVPDIGCTWSSDQHKSDSKVSLFCP